MTKIIHGLTNTRFYRIWRHIINRCYNLKDVEYKRYGNKGINVCDRWRYSFINFRDDMYESYLKHVEEYGEKDTSIDRINFKGDYEPNNCRWATILEQANNKSLNRYFLAEHKDGTTIKGKNYSAFSREHGLDFRNIAACLNNKRKYHKGWTFRYLTDEEIDIYLKEMESACI